MTIVFRLFKEKFLAQEIGRSVNLRSTSQHNYNARDIAAEPTPLQTCTAPSVLKTLDMAQPALVPILPSSSLQ